MKVLLSCTECDYEEWAKAENQLMNKIIMWNHYKKAHLGMASRISRMYKTVPNDLFDTQYAGSEF